MDLYKRFQTDSLKEIFGTWVPLSLEASIKVARIGNDQYRKCLAQKRKMYPGPEVPEEIAAQMVREAVVETILLDWKGLTADGQLVPYSKDQAMKYCTDLKDFYDFVHIAAANIEHFKVLEQAIVEKN